MKKRKKRQYRHRIINKHTSAVPRYGTEDAASSLFVVPKRQSIVEVLVKEWRGGKRIRLSRSMISPANFYVLMSVINQVVDKYLIGSEQVKTETMMTRTMLNEQSAEATAILPVSKVVDIRSYKPRKKGRRV